MRRMVSGLMLLACLTLVSFSALAAGTTVTTFTPFADMDFAAQGYMDLITAWENETGNLVEDYSGLEDDVFMQQMQEMVASGRADIVVVPLGSGLAADKLVGVDELLAAAPDCGAKKMAAMAESDGSVLLTPVRLNWESLYINTDVLEANGVAVPTSYRRAGCGLRVAGAEGRYADRQRHVRMGGNRAGLRGHARRACRSIRPADLAGWREERADGAHASWRVRR